MTATWSTPVSVRAALQRRWERGEFLTRLAHSTPWEPVDIPIRTPTAGDVAHQFAQVQQWVAQWHAVGASAMRLDYKPVGGRIAGTNRLPCRAWLDTPEQLWSLLGVTRQVQKFTALLEYTHANAPALIGLIVAQPIKVLDQEAIWPMLVRTALWIQSYAGPEVYLRQIDVPGVDTKFIESNRSMLGAMLDRLLPEERIDPTLPVSNFAGRYRMRKKPTYARFRLLDPPPGTPFTDMTVRLDELAASPPAAPTVLLVENETTFLALPALPSTVAILGGGYGVDLLRSLPWLTARRLIYWGDLDTHGFAILDRLRRSFPHAESVLMDRQTLIDHKTQWVAEPTPVDRELPDLQPAEAALYRELVEHIHGPSVRLEQERIRYSTVVSFLRQKARA